MDTITQLRGAVDAAVQYRETFLRDWKDNVNFRVGKPFGQASEQDRVAVPEDWARTRQKTAQLSFQLPKILATGKRPEFSEAAPAVAALVNDTLSRECRAAYMIDEVLADVVNGAGVMASVLGVDLRTEQVEIQVDGDPLLDPMGGPVMDAMGQPMRGPSTTQAVTRPLSQRYYWRRLSPGALLWPVEFVGSDWEESPWLGYESWVTVQEAKTRWPALADADLKGEAMPELLSADLRSDAPKGDPAEYLKIQTVWYRAAKYDEDKVHPDCLRSYTFLPGRETPLAGPETDWQLWVPATPAAPPSQGPDGRPTQGQPAQPGYYHGLTCYPIRVGTLTYVSDMAIPPSDSQAGRSQVREMIESRSQMIRQRRSSVPIRWYDVNRLDEVVAEQMRNGVWNDMVPSNGPGDRMVGEVARASYPRESFEFQRVIGGDLDRAWSMSANQLVATNSGERSAAEVNAVSSSNNTRLAYEKGRVNRYIAEGAAALFSLMQRFMTDTEYAQVVGADGVERLAPITKSMIQGAFAFDFKADSSDLVDSQAKIDRILKAYNLLGGSPSTNKVAVEREIWEALGFDPKKMTSPPQETKPDPPAISFRFSGEDLMNPVAVSLMLKAGYDIGQDEIRAAQMLIRDAVVGMQQVVQQPVMTPSGPGAPAPPAGPGFQPVEPPPTVEPILKRGVTGERFL